MFLHKLLISLPLVVAGYVLLPDEPIASPQAGTSLRLTAAGNGLSIFKDANTIALEKMVTPLLLYYTNQYRKEHGLDTLKYDACLLKAAGYHGDYLFNESNESHQFKLVHQEEPGSKWFKGKTPSDRATAAGCQKFCGENALYFTRPPQFLAATDKAALNDAAKKIARSMVYDQWDHSKPHRANMLSKDYTSFGVAVAIGKSSSSDGYINSGDPQTNADNIVIFGVQVFAY